MVRWLAPIALVLLLGFGLVVVPRVGTATSPSATPALVNADDGDDGLSFSTGPAPVATNI